MSNLVKRNGFWPSASSVDDFLNDNFFNWPNELSKGATLPRVNINESDEDFIVEMAAPGMKKDDFQVELDNDTLTISSERSQENEENGNSASFTRREFSYESFKRSFQEGQIFEWSLKQGGTTAGFRASSVDRSRLKKP